MADELQAVLQRAREALAGGDAAGAVALIQSAAAANPGQWEILEYLGAAFCSVGNLPDGIEAFQQVVDLRPSSAVAHFNLAAALRQSARYQEAERHLSVALRLDPRYEKALAARAEWEREDTITPEESAGPDAAATDKAATPAATEASDGPEEREGSPEDNPSQSSESPAASENVPAENEPPKANPDPTNAATPDGATELPERFEPGAGAPAASTGAPSIPLWEATPAHATTGVTPGAGQLPMGPPVPGSAKPPRPTFADLPVRVEDDIPTFWQLFTDTVTAPRDAFSTVLPAVAGAPGAMTGIWSVFLFAALLWAGCQVFEPGTIGAPTGAGLLEELLLSFLLAFVLVGLQALLTFIAASLVGGRTNPVSFGDLTLRFGFVWAVTTLISLGVGLVILGIGLLAGVYLPSILIAVTVALIWSFVLDVRAVRILLDYDLVRSFLIVLVAHAIADGSVLALLQLVRGIR